MKLSREEALKFFSDFFFGEHHFPSEMKEWGNGWCMAVTNSVSTYDFNHLTRLVVMAHDRCIRVEIAPKGMNRMLIIVHKRVRAEALGESLGISKVHPTMEEAIHFIRQQKTTSNDSN